MSSQNNVNEAKTQVSEPAKIQPNQNSIDITKLLVAHAQSDSKYRNLLKTQSQNNAYPLRLYQLSWRTHTKDMKKNITECCILIDKLRIPTICQSSIVDTMKTINLNQIVVNSNDNKEISLTNYIQSFCTRNNIPINHILHMTAPVNNDNSIFIENESIFYNIQLSLIPKSKNDFNFVSYNCHSQLSKPASIIIISSVYGTSTVVIEGNYQKIFFNKNGKRSNFLRNAYREYLTIIQIPLIRSAPSVETPNDWSFSSWMPWSSEPKPMPGLMNEISGKKVMQVIPRLYPTCKCTQPLTRSTANLCYGNESSIVSCDACDNNYSGDDIIWHCSNVDTKATHVHANGYDLCDACAEKQLEFSELRGINGSEIRRDFRQPIRVSFQYYLTSEMGIITPLIVNEIIDILKTHDEILQKEEKVDEEKNNDVENVSENAFVLKTNLIQNEIGKTRNMEIITAGLQGLNIIGWQKILRTFQAQNITDSDLIRIDCESDDLEILIETLGPRIRFREWLKSYQIKYREIEGIENIMNDKSIDIVRRAMFALSIEKKLIQKYIFNFLEHYVNDEMLPYLMTIMDDAAFSKLIPELGPRMVFRAWLEGSLLSEQYPNPFLQNKNKK